MVSHSKTSFSHHAGTGGGAHGRLLLPLLFVALTLVSSCSRGVYTGAENATRGTGTHRSMAEVMDYTTTPGTYEFSPLRPGKTTGGAATHDAPQPERAVPAGDSELLHPLAETADLTATAAAAAADIIRQYRRWLGIPYRSGGMDRRGFDCSGFTMTFFRDVLGISLIHSSRSQYESNCRQTVTKDKLRTGDLVFFVTSGRKVSRANINHVGIYLSDGQFIHSATRGGVRIDRLDAPYYIKTWVTGGRVLE